MSLTPRRARCRALLLLLTSCGWWFAAAMGASLPDPVADANVLPYRDVGYIHSWSIRGTGFVAVNRAVVVSAAHLFFDAAGNSTPDDSMWWEFPLGKNNAAPAGTTKMLRTHVAYTGASGYAAMVMQYGANSPRAFDQDLAVAYGYEDIVSHAPAMTPEDSIQRLRSNRDKTIVGFAGTFYQDHLRPSNSPDLELLHATEPNGDRFDAFSEALPYYFNVIGSVNNTKLIAAAGGSGSPIYIKDNNNVWLVAGVVVSGTQELLITPPSAPPMFAGTAGVRVLRTQDVTALITPLLSQFTAAPKFESNLSAGSTVLSGDYTALEVEASGWGTLTYAWFRNNQPLPAASSNPRLDLFNVSAADAGTYTVRVTNANGSVTSVAHVLTVTSSPVITGHPQPTSVAYGTFPNFSCAFRGEAPFTIQWYRGDEPLAGATSSYLSFSNGATFADEGSYRAKITNAFGEAWSDPATLSVEMGPGYIGGITGGTTQPGGQDRVVFAPAAADDVTTQFQWRRNGVEIPGATDRVLDLGRVGPGDFGSYTLAITHPRGTTSSPGFSLFAPPNPTFPETPQTRHVTSGDPLRLSRHLHAAAVITYQWFRDGQPVTGATGATLDLASVSAALTGDYTLQAITPQGTVTSSAIAVRLATTEFWRELPLQVSTPARSGGVAGGEVYFFGDRWRTRFPAGGAEPATVEAWFGPTDIVDLCAGNGTIAALARVPNGVGTVVYRSVDGANWQSQQPLGIAATALAFGNGTFVAGPLHHADFGLPWRSLTSTDALNWTETEVAWPADPAPTTWNGIALAFGSGRFVGLDWSSRVIASADGLSWTGGNPNGPVNTVQDLAHHGSRFLRVTNTTTVSYSDDGLTWTDSALSAAEPVRLTELTAGEGWFAARTSDGRLALSRDGVAWELPPTDGFTLQSLAGIGGGRLYAIRDDGVPLVSRALGTIALLAQPEQLYRVAGGPGGLAVRAAGAAGGPSYQWFRGQSGDTSAPIVGGTSARLTIPAGSGEFAAWVRISQDGFSRDSATGTSTEFTPGYFFGQQGTSRVAALVRADGTLTWLGRHADQPAFYHLRRLPLFEPLSPVLEGQVDDTNFQRSSGKTSYTRQIDATGVSFVSGASTPAVRLDDTTRVTGTLPAGYFRGGISAQAAAEIDALVLPNGRVVFGLHTRSLVLTGDAMLTPDNQVDFDFASLGQVHLAFNHTTGRFTGTWTHADATPADALRGTREAADGGIVLANLSGRSWLPAANEVTIGGFIVQGTGNQRVIARGVGPALLAYDVFDAAAHPTIRLYSGPNQVLANTRWSTDPRASEIADIGGRLGAFALDPDEDDSAFIAEVAPGAYTFHVLDPTGAGTTLAELYFDREYSGNGRLTNLSIRGRVDNAGAVVIAGFSIAGDAPRQVLLRGIGPGLAGYGVVDAAAGVEIELFRGAQSLLRQSGWKQLEVPDTAYGATGEPYMREAMAAVGAFPLSFIPNSAINDAALLVWLEAGSYTLVVRNTLGDGGTALAEVYDVPFDAPR